ncbi:MAG: T9SS type A sorting domain-containing protein [Bacteroidetes bacterium]|nr:T9SS type A sorting domain-containing protein [Bacteroidota bacterium]
MIRTNSTKLPVFNWAFLSLLLLSVSALKTQAQTMVCNNLVQVSVDNTPNACQAILNADMILEGNPLPGHDYLIEVFNYQTPVASGVNQVTISNASQYFNVYLTVKITDQTSGNSCWGQMILEDKLGPVITCTNVTVNCSDNLDLIPLPTAVDNCDPDPEINLTNEVVNSTGLCTNGYATITRTYVAIDDYGNVSAPCNRVITVNRPAIVDFPNDIIWNCEQYSAYPNIVAATPKHPYVGDSKPATLLVIDVNLNPDCDDNDAPVTDIATINSTNVPNGGLGCPGNGLDDADVLQLTGSGIVANIVGQYCNYQQTHSNQVIIICGASFKIIRTWTVLNWCTGNVVLVGVGGEDNIQVVKVLDDKVPVITRAPFTVSANIPGQHPQPCKSQGFLLPATVSDNCSTWTTKIITPVGEAIYINGPNGGGLIPPPGLPLGVHNVTYQATDACGNQATLLVPVTVVDDIAPTAICDEYTDVNITSGSFANVFATTFDDGSYDNCCFDHFEVRRMEDPCNDGHNDLVFGPSVVFCCEDITNSPVMVVFRVVDCYGNYGECMVQVFVNDKVAPTLVSCPQNQRITCDWYANNLETQLAGLSGAQQCGYLNATFGTATYYDNCQAIVTCNANINLDQCLEGTISRTFSATDPSNNNSPQSCTQTIFVDHVSDWVVEFPADITVNCGTTPPDFGEPEIFYETCELIAASYDDVLYTVVPDACYKIVRTWTIINWCVVGTNPGLIDQEVAEQPENALGLPFPQCDVDSDGDCDNRTFRDSWRSGSPANLRRPSVVDAIRTTDPDVDLDSDPWDGYITYQQVIKVIDTVDPVFTNNCQLPDVCIEGSTCGVDLILPLPEIDECSPNVTVTAEINFGGTWFSGFGPYNNVAPGTYPVRYVAADNCNNQTQCTTTITVKDCKKPTPYCKNGLVVELMVPSGMVDVWAVDLNAGSFDNCPGTLKFSFSADVNDLGNSYTCDDLGQQPVEIWVTDASGNQDFCETFIILQANMGQCGNNPLVANVGGAVSNEANESVENVTVNLSGESSGTVNTTANGAYVFTAIQAGNDVTVTPEKDDDQLNGVTTYDLVLISKHILGTAYFDSPYKLIAADANNSGSVTTFDIVEIRKLILQLVSEFPSNTSWRFVEKSYVFPNPANPWEAQFPEAASFNDIPAGASMADFVAVKIGDVNGSAATNLTGGNDDRSSGTFLLQTDDRPVTKGEEVTVEFTAEELDVFGYQFTLNFDTKSLEMVEVQPGVATEQNFGFTLLDKGAITASWDGSANANDLFSIEFHAKADGKLSDMLSINSRFTAAEAYRTNGDLLDVQLSFKTSAAQRFELYQNTPNPFKGSTTVGFNLPRAGVASLTITDVSGKVLRAFEREFAAGYNEVQLSSNELPASGILYYTLKSATETATKKMIVVE